LTESVRSTDGTIIAFERFGEGRPLVLIGGALSSRQAGVDYATALSDRFGVITYDRRGRGDSGDTQPYAVEREVEDLDALIERAGGSAFVYGHSSGAVLALRAAERGAPIEKLALYEPPFIVDDSRPPIPRDYVEHLDELLAGDRRGEALEYFMTAGVGLPDEVIAGMRNDESWKWMESLAHAIPYDGMVMGDTMSGSPEPLERWRLVAVPTLVMHGGDSPAWQRNGARAIAAVLPNARHRTLDGQQHRVAPETLAPVLIEFFGPATSG